MKPLTFPDPPPVVPIPSPPPVIFEDDSLETAARGSLERSVAVAFGIPPAILHGVMGEYVMHRQCRWCSAVIDAEQALREWDCTRAMLLICDDCYRIGYKPRFRDLLLNREPRWLR